MHPVLLDLYRSGELTRLLQQAFPGAPAELVQDALHDGVLVALERPAAFEDACARGPRSLRGLLRCVCWRMLRAAMCRGASRFEQPLSLLDEPRLNGGQELLAELGLRGEALVEEALRKWGGTSPEALREALLTRVLDGGSDAEVARAAGLRRENLNRARRHLVCGILG